MRLERHAGRIVERAGELGEQRQELRALLRLERREDARARPARGLRQAVEHFLAGARERKGAAAPVLRADRAADQPRRFELGQHHAGGRAIEPKQLRHRDLIDARPFPEQEQDAVLRGGDPKLAGFLHEQRHRDLMRAPDHEARTEIEVFQRIVRHLALEHFLTENRLPLFLKML